MTRERRVDAVFLATALIAISFLPKLLDPRPAEGLGPRTVLIIANAAVLLVAFTFAARSSRLFEQGNPVRRPWALLALGLLTLALGEITQTFYVAVLSIADPLPSLADVFFILAYPILMVAFVMFLREYRSSGFPVPSGQGVVVGAGTLGVVVAVLVLAPVLGSSAPLLERLISGGYVVLDLALLVPIVLLLRVTWAFRGGGVWKVWAGVLFGFVFTCVGDVFFACYRARPAAALGLGSQQLNTLSDVMFFVSYLAIARGTLGQLDLLRP
jgi:hypothetical protein